MPADGEIRCRCSADVQGPEPPGCTPYIFDLEGMQGQANHEPPVSLSITLTLSLNTNLDIEIMTIQLTISDEYNT